MRSPWIGWPASEKMEAKTPLNFKVKKRGVQRAGKEIWKSRHWRGIETPVNDVRNRRWMARYEEVVRFRAGHGHLKFPQENPLFDWLRYQRKRLEMGLMDSGQKALLDKVLFNWGVTALEAHSDQTVDFISEGPEWEFHFDELARFRDRHGHLRVSRPYPPSPKLPGWLSVQKTKFEKLTLSQIRRLWDLGVRFAGSENRWFFNFFKLLEGKERLGDANDVTIWDNNTPLRNWVGIQRSWHNKGRLVRRRVRLLQEIGFIWDVRDASWERHFSGLLAYHARFGNALVPYGWAENPELGRWLAKQRNRTERLTPERKRRLEELGCFTGREHLEWEERFEEWKKYVREHGSPEISSNGNFASLGSWATAQRIRKRRGELSTEYIQRLEETGFLWEPRNDHWEKHYAEMVAYRQQHGHCHIPKSLKGNPQLHAWYSFQKRLRHRGELSPERKARLNALNFPWNYKDEVWETMLGKLARFRLLYGHCRVPEDWSEPKLFKWTTRQRRAKLDGVLSSERTSRLDGLGFEWSYEPRTSEPVEELSAAIECVAEFHAQHGRCPELDDLEENAVPVAACGAINRSRDYLHAEQIIRLAALGFDFGDKRDNDWIGHFAKLEEHRNSRGRLPADDPEALARWCITQRHRQDRGVLAPYRANWLDQIGFRWLSRNKLWDIRYEELKRYKALHGHCAVPVHAPPLKHLGMWVFSQRRQLRVGKIDSDRKAKLDAIGFVWRVR